MLTCLRAFVVAASCLSAALCGLSLCRAQAQPRHSMPQSTCNLPGRRVGENNGIRFPREFALLIKQMLYFDR